MPVERLVLITTAYYRKRTVGYNRIYAAMGANQSIDMLVRVFNTSAPEYPDLYVVFDVVENNTTVQKQYRVATVQEIVDECAIDLTLERFEGNYNVVSE